MKIGNTEIDFRYTRLTDARRLSEAVEKLKGRENELKEAQGNWGATVEKSIDIYREYLFTATGKELIPADCTDLDEAEELYYGFLAEVQKQKTALEKRREGRVRFYREMMKKV